VGDRSWTTPSELAEFAFCPRALHYRRTRADPGSAAADAGTSYHAHRLGSERWRDEHGSVAWLALVAGLALIGTAAAVGLR
jgi:hypothetical protein